MQPDGSTPEMIFLGNSDKIAQLTQLDIHRHSISIEWKSYI